MRTQIRKGVFETNSSSCHSITIAEGEYIPDRIPLENGVCHIFPGEFGWGVDSFTDAANKAAYCLTYLKTVHFPDPLKSGHQIAYERQFFDMFVDVIKENTGAESVEFHPMESYTWEPSEENWGYIDHQSYDTCHKAFASKETLARFIFNPESVLHIDNDNG